MADHQHSPVCWPPGRGVLSPTGPSGSSHRAQARMGQCPGNEITVPTPVSGNLNSSSPCTITTAPDQPNSHLQLWSHWRLWPCSMESWHWVSADPQRSPGSPVCNSLPGTGGVQGWATTLLTLWAMGTPRRDPKARTHWDTAPSPPVISDGALSSRRDRLSPGHQSQAPPLT